MDMISCRHKQEDPFQGVAAELMALNITGSFITKDDIFNSFIEENKNVIEAYDGAYESQYGFDASKIYAYLEKDILEKIKGKLPILFLSGGLDSALLALILKNNNIKFLSYSYVLSDKDEAYERIKYIENKLNIKSNVVFFNRERVALLSKEYFKYYDSPILDGSALITCDLCNEVLKDLSGKDNLIFLDGNGADAIFGFIKNTWRESLKEKLTCLFSNGFTNGLRFKGYLLNALTSLICRQQRFLPCKNHIFTKILKKEAKTYIRNNPEAISQPIYRPGHGYYTKNMLSELYEFVIKQVCYKTHARITKAGHEVIYPFLSKEVMYYAFSLSNEVKIQPKLKQPVKTILMQEGFDKKFVNANKRGFGFDLFEIFDFDFIKENLKLLGGTNLMDEKFNVFLDNVIKSGDKRYSWGIYGIFMSILYLKKYYGEKPLDLQNAYERFEKYVPELLTLNVTGALIKKDDAFAAFVAEKLDIIQSYEGPYGTSDSFDADKIYKLVETQVLKEIKNRQPVLLMSGGVDSTLLALILKKNNIKFHGFTYVTSKNDVTCRKMKYVEQKMNVKSKIIVFDRERVRGILKDYFSYYNSPTLDGSALITCDLCTEASRSFSKSDELVFFDGNGPDVFLGFYGNTQRECLKERLIHLFSNKFTNQMKFKNYILNALTSLLADSYRFLPCENYLFSKIIKKELKNQIRRFPEQVYQPIYEEHHGYYTKNMLSDLYDFTIKQMCHKSYSPVKTMGQEVVYPYISKDLMHYAFTFNNKIKNSPSIKQPLKEILIREGFDKNFVYDPKRGFGFDLYEIFDFEFIKENFELLRKTNLFDDDFDIFLTRVMESGDKRYSWGLYGIFMSILYLKKYYSF